MKRMMLVILLLGTLLAPLFGMNLKIPSLELATRIFGYNGEMVVQTQTSMDILVEGGYKFGGQVVLGFDGLIGFLDNPAYGQALPPLTFKSVSVVVRDIFGIPLNFSYFVGMSDYICYGDDFPRLFGTDYIQAAYAATYSVAGTLQQSSYKGLHRVNGNGLKLEFATPEVPFGFELYVYQDHNFLTTNPLLSLITPVINMNVLFYDSGIYSADLRFLINTENVKLEAFAGGTIDSQSWSGFMRFGALAYFDLGAVDFLLVGGMPQYDFVSAFTLDLFFVLFESRINLGPVSIIPSVFMRPSRYLQSTNVAELNKIDFNLNLSVFNPRRDPVSIGAEGNLATLDLLYPAPSFQLRVLPYVALATPGVYWEIKVSLLVWDSAMPVTMESFMSSIQGIINIKAEF